MDRYELHWKNPFSLDIIVYEKNIVGYVEYMSGNLYFDGDGIVVESTKKKLPGIPKITGLKFSKVSLYKTLPVEDKAVFRDILNLSASLKAENLECDHIDYDAMSNATLYMGDIKVLLGNNEDMEQKLSRSTEGEKRRRPMSSVRKNNSSPLYKYYKILIMI